MKNKIQRIRRKFVRSLLGIDPDYGDMFESRRERFFAELYLQKIRRHLVDAFGQKKLRILDAGCQAGRLAIPLAKEGHHLTGVDTSAFALKRAKRHCQTEKVSMSFLRGDVSKILTNNSPSYDAILCIEVLYLRENYREFLGLFRRHLAAGGLLMASHRTKFFYITQALKKNDFETALFVMEHREGKLWDSYFNWQTVAQLRDLYEDAGFPKVDVYPIGTFSEILMDPEALSSENQSKLFRLEEEFCDERTACARYVLVCARKD